jgi:holo-[acyl-carrier protein] synthase
MVSCVGIHVVEVDRLTQALDRWGERLEKRVFSPRELDDCRARRDRTAALAARCAAKGACVRALAGAWSAKLTPLQIEVRREERGRPRLFLADTARALAEGQKVTGVQVSLSHDAGLAVAVVILNAAGQS